MTLAIAVVAVICLIAAFSAGSRAHAELTRKPTAAELSAAAALGVASRWQRWTAGPDLPGAAVLHDGPAQLRKRRSEPGSRPATAVRRPSTAGWPRLARRYGCRAALRASYVDQLGGVVYTLGVLAFPSPRAAGPSISHYQAGQSPVSGLRALALPGTGAAAFTDPARQAASAQHGRPLRGAHGRGLRGRPGRRRDRRAPGVRFAPATQLATEIGMPLTQPVTVRCAAPEWSC